jgi:hypothetical protein
MIQKLLALLFHPATIPTVTALFSFFAWLIERNLLPPAIRQALAKLGEKRIVKLIRDANLLLHLSKEERREWVITELVALAKREGIDLPEGFIRIAVEYVFQRFEKGRLL